MEWDRLSCRRRCIRDHRVMMSGCAQACTHVDAGHAEDGPSTGGHTGTLDSGETRIHSLTGQHHAVMLGMTDSENHVRAVTRGGIAPMAFTEFMTEFG